MGFFDSIAYHVSSKNFGEDPLELSGIQTNIPTELQSIEQISSKNFEKNSLELSGNQTNIKTELESTEKINNWCFEIIFKWNELSSSTLSFFYFFDFKGYSISNKDENWKINCCPKPLWNEQ